MTSQGRFGNRDVDFVLSVSLRTTVFQTYLVAMTDESVAKVRTISASVLSVSTKSWQKYIKKWTWQNPSEYS